MSDKPKFYLSGPMKGYHQNNFPAFEAATAALRAHGVSVISPHEVTPEGIAEPTPQEFLHADLRHMLDCEGIIMLPGWPQSRGARLELAIATDLHWPVYFLQLAQDGTVTLVSMDTGAVLEP